MVERKSVARVTGDGWRVLPREAAPLVPRIACYKVMGSFATAKESGFWRRVLTGPQILTVRSSEALASISGYRGFQATQFTVRVCPVRTATGISFLRL